MASALVTVVMLLVVVDFGISPRTALPVPSPTLAPNATKSAQHRRPLTPPKFALVVANVSTESVSAIAAVRRSPAVRLAKNPDQRNAPLAPLASGGPLARTNALVVRRLPATATDHVIKVSSRSPDSAHVMLVTVEAPANFAVRSLPSYLVHQDQTEHATTKESATLSLVPATAIRLTLAQAAPHAARYPLLVLFVAVMVFASTAQAALSLRAAALLAGDFRIAAFSAPHRHQHSSAPATVLASARLQPAHASIQHLKVRTGTAMPSAPRAAATTLSHPAVRR